MSRCKADNNHKEHQLLNAAEKALNELFLKYGVEPPKVGDGWRNIVIPKVVELIRKIEGKHDN